MDNNKPNLRLPVENFRPVKPEDSYLSGPGAKGDYAGAKQGISEELKVRRRHDKKSKPTEAEKKTYQALDRASKAIWEGDFVYDELVDDMGSIVQSVEHEGEEIRMTPRSRIIGAGKAKDAVGFLIAFNSAVRHGREVSVPLWSSGFHVTVSNFEAEDVFRLIGKLKEVRDEVGIRTNGILYSIDDVHITTVIVDFILDHVVDSNLVGWEDRSLLEELLQVSDIGHLQAGALDAKYPNGYPLRQECSSIVNDVQCDYVTSSAAEGQIADLLFLRTAMTISNRFNNKKKSHMTKDSVTADEVRVYQSDLFQEVTADSTIGVYDLNGTTVKLYGQHPSYQLYKSEGMTWINDLTNLVSEAMDSFKGTAKERRTERLGLIDLRIKQLTAQYMSSWVRRVGFRPADGKESFTDEREGVIKALATLSELGKGKDIQKKAFEFQKTQLHTFNAIPNFTCPKCKQAQPTVDEELNLIPIPMTAYFFAILMMSLAPKD